jgi:hypothetical protein
MLRAALRKLKQLSVEPVPFDASALGDEVALQTSWTPAKGGGASFQTHRLVDVDHQRSEFRATKGALAFAAVFMAFGLIPIPIIVVAEGLGAAMIMPIVISMIFVGIGAAMLWFNLAPIVFDKRRGEYWKGRVAPYEASNVAGLKHYAKLGEVHALQIISERCTSKNSSYYSYELNLVLADASRLNVVDHGKLERLREDASRLAAFLEKPVWDATVG